MKIVLTLSFIVLLFMTSCHRNIGSHRFKPNKQVQSRLSNERYVTLDTIRVKGRAAYHVLDKHNNELVILDAALAY